MFFHLPNPIGWIALDPCELQKAKERAREQLPVFADAGERSVRNSDVAPLLLTAEAAAAMLSVDAEWLLRQAREGRIPHVRLGRYVRFDSAAIAAYCARAPRPPATATASALGRRTRGGGNRG
jgi:excisionase family DNA binding protein